MDGRRIRRYLWRDARWLTKVKGGRDLAVPSFAKWMVCSYDGGVTWWEALKPETVKDNRCVIQVRNKIGRDPMDIKMRCQ